MKSWDLGAIDLKPRLPEILSSTSQARAIVLDLRAGEGLGSHEVHERAWVVIIRGEIEATSGNGDRVAGGPGLALEFAPGERHSVDARSNARLLLLLTPWPGDGHPGAMTFREKLYVRRRAAKSRTE